MKFSILATLFAIAASSSIENPEVPSQPSRTYGVAAADGFERNELDKPFDFNDTVLGDGLDSCDFSGMTVHDPAHIRAIMAHPQYIRCEAKKAARKAAMSERASEESK